VQKQLLTVDEARAVVSRGRTAFYSDIREGRIKVVRFGRSVRVPVDELDRYVEDARREAGLQPMATVA
jgi:excisionase family DNA binding protein